MIYALSSDTRCRGPTGNSSEAPVFTGAPFGITASVPSRNCCRPSPCARALPGSKYYGGSAPSRADRSTMDPARTPCWSHDIGQRRDGSHVHCDSLDEGGAQLCPCGIATATPQHVTVASWTDIHKPAQKFPVPLTTEQVRTAPSPYLPDLSRFTFRRTYSRWFLAYSTPSRSPNPHHLTVLSASRLCRGCSRPPGTSRISCPQLHRSCCDKPGGEGLSPPLETSAPRGARGSR